jgi:hypothetical protein
MRGLPNLRKPAHAGPSIPPLSAVAVSTVVSLLPPQHLASQIAPLFGPLQLLGYLACAVSFSAFFAASHRRFQLVGATGAMLWALHYHLLGERVAAALSALSSGRNTIAPRVHRLTPPLRIALTLCVCALVVALAFVAGRGPFTVLPAFASCLTTTASFWLVGRAFRRVYLVSDSCWLVFGLLAGSIAGSVAASISLGLNLWTMRRHARAGTAAPASTAGAAA